MHAELKAAYDAANPKVSGLAKNSQMVCKLWYYRNFQKKLGKIKKEVRGMQKWRCKVMS